MIGKEKEIHADAISVPEVYVVYNMLVRQTMLDYAWTDINQTIENSLIVIFLNQALHLFTVT